ncbi:MAG: hypothetical protein R6U98_25380 [Pirellulaceae bacterium]
MQHLAVFAVYEQRARRLVNVVEETLADPSGILFVIESEGEAKPRRFSRLQFATA